MPAPLPKLSYHSIQGMVRNLSSPHRNWQNRCQPDLLDRKGRHPLAALGCLVSPESLARRPRQSDLYFQSARLALAVPYLQSTPEYLADLVNPSRQLVLGCPVGLPVLARRHSHSNRLPLLDLVVRSPRLVLLALLLQSCLLLSRVLT